MEKVPIRLIECAASSVIAEDGCLLNDVGITNWLLEKKIIDDKDKLMSFSDIEAWHRGGAETFHSVFEVRTFNCTKIILIKALVNMFPCTTLDCWARRRKMMETNKISVSNWYWSGNGIIIEDYYPKKYFEVSNFNNLLEIAYKLDTLGYKPLNFLDDIRCDKQGTPFYIDFGFDLGETSNENLLIAEQTLLKALPDKTQEIINYYNSNLYKTL